MLLSWGDCHQFASWHLNHPLQIWVFEMQIQLRLPRQIKRHTQEWGKIDTFKFLLVFIIRVFIVKHSLLCLFPGESGISGWYCGILTVYVCVCSFVHPTQRKRKDREVLFLSCPWLQLFAPREVCSIKCFSLFFFKPPHKTQWENMIHIFPSSLHLSDTTVI